MGEVELYADVLFLINAGMDTLCFCLTARLLHRKVPRGRILLGAVLGGVYAVIALFPNLPPLAALLLDVGMCILMCGAVFGCRKGGHGRDLFLVTAVYFTLSFLLGGAMTGLYSLLNRAGIPDRLPEGEDGLSAWMFAFLAAVGGGTALFGGRLFRRARVSRSATVCIRMNGRSVTLCGLSDTGNLLRDPVSGRPVIPVAVDALGSLISPTLRIMVESGQMDAESAAGTPEARRLRLIPATTAGGTMLMTALIPDSLTITVQTARGDKSMETDALFAPTALPDPPRTPDGRSVEAIIPAELLDF